jgi:hypothetical protein
MDVSFHRGIGVRPLLSLLPALSPEFRRRPAGVKPGGASWASVALGP